MTPEADEQLEPVIVPLAEAIAMCLDGRIRDAKTVTLLLLWERLAPLSPCGRGAGGEG
jgi:ADP-ribose pyrophosphatase